MTAADPWEVNLPASGPERDAAMIRAAADQLGELPLADWAVRLLTGAARAGDDGDPDPSLIGAVPGWMPYWSRVWGARALVHVWHPKAADAVLAALGDKEWRVRVLAAQIVALHGLGVSRGGAARGKTNPYEAGLVRLTDDTEPHVRSAATRALGEVGTLESVPVLDRLVMDPDSVVSDAAENALARMAKRLDRPDLNPLPEY